jgi:hypothetical protein
LARYKRELADDWGHSFATTGSELDYLSGNPLHLLRIRVSNYAEQRLKVEFAMQSLLLLRYSMVGGRPFAGRWKGLITEAAITIFQSFLAGFSTVSGALA